MAKTKCSHRRDQRRKLNGRGKCFVREKGLVFDLRSMDSPIDSVVLQRHWSIVRENVDREYSIWNRPLDNLWFSPTKSTCHRIISSDNDRQLEWWFDRVVSPSICSEEGGTNHPRIDDRWYPEVVHRNDRSNECHRRICNKSTEYRECCRIQTNEVQLVARDADKCDWSIDFVDEQGSILLTDEQSAVERINDIHSKTGKEEN